MNLSNDIIESSNNDERKTLIVSSDSEVHDDIHSESEMDNEFITSSHGKSNSNRIRDKGDKAVAEKVIDKRVALILYRYRNSGFIKSIYGCISTGKEANVYYAVGGKSSQGIAVKIYKTSILDYKDRRRYLEGDLRLKYWNVGRNTRRIVRKWAEKEMRNLIRLEKANINAPRPLKVRDIVLTMTFLGNNGMPYATLKSAPITEDMLEPIFFQGIDILKKLYYTCGLVHGDFSEYNLLVELRETPINNTDMVVTPILYVIDVSQAVENTGPRAFDFLKEDINNFLLFLSKKGMNLPTLKTIFSLITDNSIDPSKCQNILIELLDKINSNDEETIETYHNDYVFRNTFIERNLHDVINYEEDVLAAINGTPNDMPYAEATGLLETFLNKLSLNESFSDGSDHSSQTDDDNSNDNIECNDAQNHPMHKLKETVEEKRARRKDNKASVKEANRERRKNKMPKKVKKMLIKKSKDKN